MTGKKQLLTGENIMDNLGEWMTTKMGSVGYKNIIWSLEMLIQKIEERNKLLMIIKSQKTLSTPKQSEDSTVPWVHSFVGYE